MELSKVGTHCAAFARLAHPGPPQHQPRRRPAAGGCAVWQGTGLAAGGGGCFPGVARAGHRRAAAVGAGLQWLGKPCSLMEYRGLTWGCSRERLS